MTKQEGPAVWRHGQGQGVDQTECETPLAPPQDEAQVYGVSLAVTVGLSVSIKSAFAAHAASGRPRHHLWERDELYPAVVRDRDRRVIECRDGIQWIVQRRRQGGCWIDLGYFRNRDVLIERCRMSTTVLDVVRALPPMHLGTQKPPGEDREASCINARVFQSVMQTKKRNYR